jgi:hypothetical protein
MRTVGGPCGERCARPGKGDIAAPPLHHSRPCGAVRSAAAAPAVAAYRAAAAATEPTCVICCSWTGGVVDSCCEAARHHCRGTGAPLLLSASYKLCLCGRFCSVRKLLMYCLLS